MSKLNFVPAIRSISSNRNPSRWFVFRKYRLLVHRENDHALALIPLIVDPSEIGIIPLRTQYIGMLDGVDCYSAEVEDEINIPEGWSFQGLRQLFGYLPDDIFSIASTAVQIVDWDRNHQFCGRCGTRTHNKENERAKECPQCGLIHYPRISPAVIVLIERENRLLLARSKRHPTGMYSVLAGFVEPGETLEEAVVREIREEVGIEIKDIKYFGSQSWPFPNSLMIAFTCQYAAGAIILDQEEMADAGWYTVDSLPLIPPKISIARQLIDWFVARHSDQQVSNLRDWTFDR